MNKVVATLGEEKLELLDQVEEIMSLSSDILVTFEKGKYNEDIRACCYELLSLNVGVNNIKPVITTVLHNIAHKEVDRLPSKSSLCNMMVESLTIVQAQLGEELSKEEAKNCTLQTDGTTKYGQHFATYDVSTTDGVFTLGLRHVFSGSAQDTLDALLEILDDLDAVRKEIGESAVSTKIVANLKNTMSDRHAAEKLFSQILAEYRADILPDVMDGWKDMTDDEHNQLIRMNNFFCGLHFLVGLADSAEATLKLWETTFDEDSTQEKQSSGTQRLIRTACKAFHHRGSEQAGCSTRFRVFLRSKGVNKIPLAAFRGNRFNILFFDAAGVYYLKSYMIEYLSESHGDSLNRLLQAVLVDLKSHCYIAGCKALGIVDKLVTGPLWRYLQTSTISILDMSETYTTMKIKFDEWAEDAQCIVDNQDLLFAAHTDPNDEVARFLFQSTENDAMVQELLQLIFKSFSLTLQRLLVDHLPGGEFHGVTDPTILSETKSVPKTNVSPERDFAILDRLMSQKPNATYIALESLLLYSHNKTSAWLQSKTPDERKRLFHAARTMTSLHRKNFAKRREEIVTRRMEAIARRERELLKKRTNELKKKEELTLRIQRIGLWTSRKDMQDCLDGMSTKKAKIDALKVQINFRRKVLGQTHADKAIFQFSHNRKPLSVDQLAQNLSVLFCGGSCPQELSPDQLVKDPELLIYRRIEHLFDCEGQNVWFKGTVLAYNKGNKQFTVAYDGEGETYDFHLLDDLEKGELRIIS